jgi:hypothetical protein
MKKPTLLRFIVIAVIIASGCNAYGAKNGATDLTKEMEDSIVYLKTSFYGYEQAHPWKNKDLSESWACASAVGRYEVITPAWNVANVAFIKAQRHGQNEFIGAKIKVVDYESNLCLIELDANAMSAPLKPLKFSQEYSRGAEVGFYWLASDNFLYSGRGFIDRARVERTNISYEKRLHYIIANTSVRTGIGQVYCIGGTPIGIACWSNDNKEAGLIPGEIINAFLAQATSKNTYKGFGSVGFVASDLVDPAMRSFLRMPPTITNGVYISDVYTLGTGSDVLKNADVVLAIDGLALNPYGLFEHPEYGQINFAHLITAKSAGDKIAFEIWREGQKKQIEAQVRTFKASQMLVPYYEYDHQPEYIITNGFILQKLTHEYMAQWGPDWKGKVLPHLYYYYRDFAFKPTPERQDIVILSYVLPTQFNLGYHDLRQLVVKKVNGMAIRSIKDVTAARKLNPDSKYDVIEFELDQPIVVIDRQQLPTADAMVGNFYGIDKLANINR